MSKYVLGTRGHDYGKGKVKDVFSRIQEDGWSCTQLALKKLVEGVKSYEDVTPELVKEVEAAMKSVPMDVAVLGTYVELGAVDDRKRQSAVADFISQIPVCKALN
ncbi:MAG: sugar phosphate isomerase/epimerase, partial [Lachnospiraceae bacterium]|nr:sugar phosphate isomerase/epimerase [Lachnospiraceae bacterium]